MGLEKQKLVDFRTEFIKMYGPEVGPASIDEIKVTCPQCFHKSLVCNIVSGKRYCFFCSYGHGLMPLEGKSTAAAVQAPVTIDPELHAKVARYVIQRSTLDPTHREYLRNRGVLNPEKFCIVTAGFNLFKDLVEEFTKDELVDSGFFTNTEEPRLGPALSSFRILIPYFEDGKVVTLKSRIRPYAFFDTNEFKWITPKGSQIGGRIWHLKRPTKEVIITEGELKAAVAVQHGYDAVGLSGVSMSLRVGVINRLHELCSHCDRIYICMDSDADYWTKTPILKTNVQLYEALPNCAIVRLPQKENEKVDLDSYIIDNDLEDFDYLLEDSWLRRKETYEQFSKAIGP